MESLKLFSDKKENKKNLVSSLQAKNEEQFSIKETANIYNVSEDTIKNCIRKLMPNKMSNGIKTLLNKEEITMISKELKNNTYITSHLTYEVSSQVQNINTELEIIENAKKAFKQLISLQQDKIKERDKIIQQQKQIIEEKEKENEILTKKQNDYSLITKARVKNQELIKHLNQAIRAYGIANHKPAGVAYKYFYDKFANLHFLQQPVSIKTFKNNNIYCKELLDIVLSELKFDF